MSALCSQHCSGFHLPRGRIWDAIVLKSEYVDAKMAPIRACSPPSWQLFTTNNQYSPTMAVRLRFSLSGPRHSRIFHLVAVDQNARRDKPPLETLAIFDPQLKNGEQHKTVRWSTERIRYWLRNGAHPTDSVVKLLTLVGRLT